MASPLEMAPVRIVAADLPDPFFASLDLALAAVPDLLLTTRVSGRLDLLLAVGAGADIVLLGVFDGGLPGVVSHLLMEFPDLRVLLIELPGGSIRACWRGLRLQDLGALPADQMAGPIRDLHRLNPMEI